METRNGFDPCERSFYDLFSYCRQGREGGLLLQPDVSQMQDTEEKEGAISLYYV